MLRLGQIFQRTAIGLAALARNRGHDGNLFAEQTRSLGNDDALLAELHHTAALEVQGLDNRTALKVAERGLLVRHLVSENLHIAAHLTQAARHLGELLVLGAHLGQAALHAFDLRSELALALLHARVRLLARANRLEMQAHRVHKVVEAQFRLAKVLVQQGDLGEHILHVISLATAPRTERVGALLDLARSLGIRTDKELLGMDQFLQVPGSEKMHVLQVTVAERRERRVVRDSCLRFLKKRHGSSLATTVDTEIKPRPRKLWRVRAHACRTAPRRDCVSRTCLIRVEVEVSFSMPHSTHKRSRSATRADRARGMPGGGGRWIATVYKDSEVGRQERTESIDAHPFNHQLDIVVPAIDDAFLEMFREDIEGVARGVEGACIARVPLTLFLTPEFVAKYIRTGTSQDSPRRTGRTQHDAPRRSGYRVRRRAGHAYLVTQQGDVPDAGARRSAKPLCTGGIGAHGRSYQRTSRTIQ